VHTDHVDDAVEQLPAASGGEVAQIDSEVFDVEQISVLRLDVSLEAEQNQLTTLDKAIGLRLPVRFDNLRTFLIAWSVYTKARRWYIRGWLGFLYALDMVSASKKFMPCRIP
jgi:hypothetical protein